MSRSVEGRFEEIARKARQVQDAIDGVRARADVDGVRIVVAPDGRITALELPDSRMAQAISHAHERALAHALECADRLRGELTADPAVATAWRLLMRPVPESSKTAAPHDDSVVSQVDAPNPYALPAAVRHRYGLP
ncbi:hypothetical protein ACFXPS_14160 [Nocardia sp. NPDC059091]|uniref:hypothetical protein n=1 Tax=unclassified Nocardia TaxID=2637762 RepID=UPI00368CEE2F